MFCRHRLANERGQSAILIAMMFNVLFVFFAMAINVALVVHDKINLQNSVDLAAYYAGAKQAEILNVIAHENYMIRQSWKLLAWRFRVLGSIGMIDSGVAHPSHTGNVSDTLYQQDKDPSVCMTYQPNWAEVPPGEDLCRRPDVRIPKLPQVQVIFSGLPLNQSISNLSTQLINQFNKQCQKHGAYNWWFGMNAMQAFRVDQRNRMQVIKALADDLWQGKNGDFRDLDGASVLAGAQKTFQKNLTFSNVNTVTSFSLVNGLEGIDQSKWLPHITIQPTLVYSDVDNSTGDCVAVNRTLDDLPHEQGGIEVLNLPWGGGGVSATDLIPWAAQMKTPNPTTDWQFTLGVEKNPWYMAYVGAKAATAPREIFFPVAGNIAMNARAYAKPFGGRIGPWYGDHWDQGAATSSGNWTDNLGPPRVLPDGSFDSADLRNYPNYSRYPGDQLGLMSNLSQNSITNLGTFTSKFGYYINIKSDFAPGGDNDIMPWDGATGPDIRFIEMAAIAPDLFDATYYSIEPNFRDNYLNRLQQSASALGIPSTTVLRPDLGSNGTAIQLSIQDQLTTVQTKGLQKQEAYYFIRDKFNLLTSWLPAPGAFSYDVTSALQNFGKCAKPDDTYKVKNPGSCVAGGGRTGYSTKLVSRDMLMTTELPLGGATGSSGIISNPPQD